MKFLLSFIFLIFLSGFVYAITIPQPEVNEKPLIVLNKSYGTVTSVSDCYNKKLHTYCNVETDNFKFKKLNVSFQPLNKVDNGDLLSLRTDIYEHSARVYKVQNDYEELQSVCPSYMPCFIQYKKHLNEL